MNANRLPWPGGMPLLIMAASMAIVPEPQNGSINGMPGAQPDMSSSAAAIFSLRGALTPFTL